jgi:alanine racemase
LLWGRTTGAVRIGIGLYGSTLGESGDAPELRTAIDVRATVIALKRFDVATPLGYGGKDVAAPGDSIATLRIGYADGLPSALADGGGAARIGGARCAIAGAIGMNCTMVRVRDGVDVRVGDEAMLLGDAAGIRIDEVASAAATIPHALLTSLCNGMRRGTGVPS